MNKVRCFFLTFSVVTNEDFNLFTQIKPYVMMNTIQVSLTVPFPTKYYIFFWRK